MLLKKLKITVLHYCKKKEFQEDTQFVEENLKCLVSSCFMGVHFKSLLTQHFSSHSYHPSTSGQVNISLVFPRSLLSADLVHALTSSSYSISHSAMWSTGTTTYTYCHILASHTAQLSLVPFSHPQIPIS